MTEAIDWGRVREARLAVTEATDAYAHAQIRMAARGGHRLDPSLALSGFVPGGDWKDAVDHDEVAFLRGTLLSLLRFLDGQAAGSVVRTK